MSPRALEPRSGAAATVSSGAGAGTGAFEIRGGAGTGVVLARNTRWWGTEHGLGPALDQIQLRVAPDASERVRLLRRGEAEAAWSLPASVAARLREDPLLTGILAPADRSVGLERSVRGIDSAAPAPPLESVWLTRIGSG